MACDEVCGKKRGRSKGDAWWCNEEVKEDAHKAMCWNSTEENMRRYESMKHEANNAVSKAICGKSEEALTEIKQF